MSDIQSKTVRIYIDHAAAEVALENLQKGADGFNKKIEKARLEQAKLLQKIAENEKAGKDTNKLQAQYDRLGKSINTVTDQLENNAKAQKKVTDDMNSGLRPSLAQTERLVTKLRNELRGMSEDAEGYADKFKKFRNATAELDRMKSSLNGVEKAQNSWMQQAKVVGFGVVIGNTIQAAIGAIGGYLSGFVSGNAKLSDSLAQVEKATGLTTAQVRDLNSALGKIDTRTSTADLREIAIGLGQVGEAATAANVAALDQIVVALGDEFGGGAKEITTTLSILRNNLQDIKTGNYGEDIGHLGNALNELGAKGLATAPVITDFANRMAGIAGTFKLTAGEILGTAATFQELGINVERGSTAFTKILQKIASEPEKFAKIAGSSIKEFTHLVNTDMLGAFSKVAEGAKKAGASNVAFATILKDLDADGSGAGEVLSKVAKNADLLKEKVDLASKSLTNTSSITSEFNKVNNNLAADLAKLGKVIAGVFTNSAVSSVIGHLVRDITSLFKPAKDAAEELGKLQKSVTSLEKDILPLINRVDELTQKATKLGGESKLSKEEQVELNKAILAIASNIPSAITQWDKLGNAINISTVKAREFIDLQQNILKEKNRDQITDFQKTLNELNDQLIKKQTAIAFAASNDARSIYSDAYIKSYAKTEEALTKGRIERANYIKRLSVDVATLQSRIQGVQGNIDELTGKALDKDLAAKAEAARKAKDALDNTTVETEAQRKEREKREKELANAQKKGDDERARLFKEYNDFVKSLNENITDLLTPEASKKLIAILKEAQKETDRLNEIKNKGAIDQLQLTEALAIVDKKRSVAIRELLADQEKTFKAPVNKSIVDDADLPAQLKGRLENQPPVEVSVPIEILPQIDSVDQAEMNKALVTVFNRLKRNFKAGFEVDILNAGNRKERRDALIAQLEDERTEVLANKDLTDTEIEVKQLGLNEKLRKINDEYLQSLLQDISLALEFVGQVTDVLEKFSQVKNNKENAALKKELSDNETKKASYKKQLDNKIISQQRYNQLVNDLDRDADKKKDELAKKQFERNKKFQLAQAGISGAQAVLKTIETFGVPFPPNFLGIGAMLLTLGTIAAEVAVISSAKYALGGKVEQLGNGKITATPNAPTQPGGDNVLAMVKPGEVILNEDQQRRAGGPSFFKSLGVPGFAGGGHVVRPFWKTRPYQSLNYPEILRTQRVVQYATGGMVLGTSSENKEESDLVANTLSQTNQTNLLLLNTVAQLSAAVSDLNDHLAAGLNVSLHKLETAQALKARTKKEAGG
jgi:TP901 family phage tail tape measure protein